MVRLIMVYIRVAAAQNHQGSDWCGWGFSPFCDYLSALLEVVRVCPWETPRGKPFPDVTGPGEMC